MKARRQIRAPARSRIDDIAFALCLSSFAAALAVVLVSASVGGSDAGTATAVAVRPARG